jgi:hypothetical protein
MAWWYSFSFSFNEIYEFKPLVLSHGMQGKRGAKVDA